LLYCNGEWFGDTSLIGKHEDYDGDPWLD
jgi:hypothetical protein